MKKAGLTGISALLYLQWEWSGVIVKVEIEREVWEMTEDKVYSAATRVFRQRPLTVREGMLFKGTHPEWR